MVSKPNSAAIARALAAWYERGHRDLPWRRTRDPYAIWVSEIMLQQTRVDTVLSYYERFMRRFPDARTLAQAPLDAVLQQWSGLGYYRRARQLHLAAGEVMERYGGALPSKAQELQSLTGIGRYSAGAIASIAFDEPAPLVDGNVMRVLSRLYAIDDDMKSAAGQKRAWALAAELVPKTQPGRFNQALMELGATVCTPRAPACDRCPLARSCVALATERVAELPRLGARRDPKRVSVEAAVIRHRPTGRVLFARRPLDGLYGGMWEPPMLESSASLGLKSVALRRMGEVTHVLTHRRLEITVLAADVARALRLQPPSPYLELAWRAQREVALSTLARKVLRCAEERG